MKSLIIRLLHWILAHLEPPVESPSEPQIQSVDSNTPTLPAQLWDIAEESRGIVQAVRGRFPTQSYEFIRHAAFGMLVKIHPELSISDISLATDLAFWKERQRSC